MKYLELLKLTEENPEELCLRLSSMPSDELTETLKGAADYLQCMDIKEPQNMKHFSAIMELLANELEGRLEREWGREKSIL